MAFALRIGFIALVPDIGRPEMYEHGMIARNMLAGNGFTMHEQYYPLAPERIAQQQEPRQYGCAVLPPLSPFVIYLFLSVFRDCTLAFVLMMVFHSIVGTATVYLIWRFVSYVHTARSALIAAAIGAVFLPAAYSITTFTGSVFYHFLAIAILFAAVASLRSQRTKHFALLGFLCGLMTLVRSEFLAYFVVGFLVLIGLSLAKRLKKQTPNSLRSAAIGLAIGLVVVAPWTIRNYRIFNTFVPVVSHPWYEVWRGFNDKATGGFYGVDKSRIWVGMDDFKYLSARLDSIPYDSHFEIAKDSIFKEEALTFIKANPLKSLYIATKRAAFLWTIDPYAKKGDSLLYKAMTLVVSIGFALWLALSLRSRKQAPFPAYAPVVASFFVYYTLLIASVNLEPRFQVYIINTAIPVAGIGYSMLIDRWRRTSGSPAIQDSSNS